MALLVSKPRRRVAEPSPRPTNKVLVMTGVMLVGQVFQYFVETDVITLVYDVMNVMLAFIAGYSTYDLDNTPGY